MIQGNDILKLALHFYTQKEPPIHTSNTENVRFISRYRQLTLKENKYWQSHTHKNPQSHAAHQSHAITHTYYSTTVTLNGSLNYTDPLHLTKGMHFDKATCWRNMSV
ncbi:hypothetical protein FKM82_012589 [Ascaphus truei]